MVVISDPSLSREHCSITVNVSLIRPQIYDQDSDFKMIRVQDSGSKYGTSVNGTRITEMTQLHEGDQVKLGNVAFK